jgi:transcriptional regulator with XRE-family HTH domain
MKKKSFDEFFSEEPDSYSKAISLLNDFYHLVLTYMEREKIKPIDIAKKMNKSRSWVSQLFNKKPNISLYKMVEIADAVGIDLEIFSEQVPFDYDKRVKVVVVHHPKPTSWYTLSNSGINNKNNYFEEDNKESREAKLVLNPFEPSITDNCIRA